MLHERKKTKITIEKVVDEVSIHINCEDLKIMLVKLLQQESIVTQGCMGIPDNQFVKLSFDHDQHDPDIHTGISLSWVEDNLGEIDPK